MIDNNELISLIVQVDKNDAFIVIKKNIVRFHNYLKQRYIFYELIVIPIHPRILSHEDCNNLINSLTNTVIINPLEHIDEDLGMRIGVENSIGEKVITCFHETLLNDLDTIINCKTDNILIGTSKKNKINNILLLDRSVINTLLNHYNNTRTFIFTRDLSALPFGKQVVILDANPRRSGLFFSVVKALRLLYNDHLLKTLLLLEGTVLLSLLLLLGTGINGALHVASKYYALVAIFGIILLLTVKLLRKKNDRNKINYDLYKSNYNYLNKLNVE